MTLETVSKNRSFDGTQYVFSHPSSSNKCDMRFAAYVPDRAEREKLPVLYYLSGVTCTEENFTVKAGAQRFASREGLILIVPDTSPRGDHVADVESEYMGTGAGFYVNATEEPWAGNYRMYDYVVEELPDVVGGNLPADMERQSIFGHSMGGHGALVVALRNPGRFKSVSVLAAMCHPMGIEFGQSIFKAYLGPDEEAWKAYDARELVEAGHRFDGTILLDQGDKDDFYTGGNMKPELFVEACDRAGQPAELRMRPGYDHSYFYVATFIEEHIAHHAEALRG